MKYKIGDIVLYGDKSIFCEYFPMEVKIMSGKKLGLFGFYYYTRLPKKTIDGIPEYYTKRIYQKNIEKLITNKYIMRFKDNQIRLGQHLINILSKDIKKKDFKNLTLTEYEDILKENNSLIYDKIWNIEDEDLMKILFN